MQNILFILFGKFISKLFRLLNIGDGSTWPGHIALGANKNFVKDVLSLSKTKIIIVAGTNGKTTTSALVRAALKGNKKKVFQNKSGANLLNGIASSLIINSSLQGKLNYDFAILEIDENALPQILQECSPDYLILLNLFRDQLDRYGEINTIVKNWRDTISSLTIKTTIIANADDPEIAFLAKVSKAKILYFGLSGLEYEDKNPQHSADSNYCPNCSDKLTYNKIAFSHLGDWTCKSCGLTRPKLDINNFPAYPLPGTYNKYNTLASVLMLRQIGVPGADIKKSFTNFKPAFGRQEVVFYKDKKVQIFLSKNPTSFNESFQTISDLNAKTLLIVLNDRIPDGKDISWIWDVDMPNLNNYKHILIAGDRVYDMALRLKYEDYKNFQTYENLAEAISKGINLATAAETLFVLPTYSAMLETRKILTGKKIL